MTEVIVGFDVLACVHVDTEHGHINRVAIDPLPTDRPRHLAGLRERLEAAIPLCDDAGLTWPRPETFVVRRGRPGSGGPIERFAGEFAFLSNFHPSPVAHRGVLYPTLEHAFQAAKSGLEHERREIRDAPTPGRAKRLGGRVRLPDGWEASRVDVMRALLVDKFARHPDLAERLVATGTRLVEGNTWGDRFWGVCDGRGHNQLGRLLMEIRAQLTDRHAAPPGGPQDLEGLGDEALAELVGAGLASLWARISDPAGDYDPEWCRVLARACDAWDELAEALHPPAGATR